jgi:hypothetical protein
LAGSGAKDHPRRLFGPTAPIADSSTQAFTHNSLVATTAKIELPGTTTSPALRSRRTTTASNGARITASSSRARRNSSVFSADTTCRFPSTNAASARARLALATVAFGLSRFRRFQRKRFLYGSSMIWKASWR